MGISIWQLLIILAIVVLLFGTSKLRNIGGDLGAALKNFKSSMGSAEHKDDTDGRIEDSNDHVFDAEVDKAGVNKEEKEQDKV